MDKVQCANCGLLALRSTQTNTLDEVHEETRKDGKLFLTDNGPAQDINAPCCVAMQFDLQEELRMTPGVTKSASFITMIGRDRACDSFTKWMPSFSPKEHREMLAENHQREWERRETEANKKREDDRDVAQREWQAAENAKTRDLQKRSLWIACVAIGVAIIGVIANIIVAAYRHSAP